MDSILYGRFVGVTKRLLHQLIYPDRVGSDPGDGVRTMATRTGTEAFLRQQTAILGRPDSRPLLGTIAMPTLVAVGHADEIAPPWRAEEIHRGIAGSVLHVFERCGHLPPMELPEEITLRGTTA